MALKQCSSLSLVQDGKSEVMKLKKKLTQTLATEMGGQEEFVGSIMSCSGALIDTKSRHLIPQYQIHMAPAKYREACGQGRALAAYRSCKCKHHL